MNDQWKERVTKTKTEHTTSINLVDEGINTEEDIKFIFQELSSSVTSLSLWNNEIGDDGARAIAECLKVNSSLTELNLYINEIGDDGARAIAECLKVNSSLTSLEYVCYLMINSHCSFQSLEQFNWS